MNWIFCKIEEVKQPFYSFENTGVGMSARYLGVDNDSQKKPQDLIMLGASDPREMGNAFEKQMDVVIQRRAMATSINLIQAI